MQKDATVLLRFNRTHTEHDHGKTLRRPTGPRTTNRQRSQLRKKHPG